MRAKVFQQIRNCSVMPADKNSLVTVGTQYLIGQVLLVG